MRESYLTVNGLMDYEMRSPQKGSGVRSGDYDSHSAAQIDCMRFGDARYRQKRDPR